MMEKNLNFSKNILRHFEHLYGESVCILVN